jgi:hypothetical protein
MSRILTGLTILLLIGPSLQADDKLKDKSLTPREQYDALMVEWPVLAKEYTDAMNKAKSQKEREKVSQEKAPWIRLPPRFLELAEKYPKDPVALDALHFVVVKTNMSVVGKDRLSSRALQILLRDHIGSDKLTLVCLHMRVAKTEANEAFLRVLLEKSPHREVRGYACFVLTRWLKDSAGQADKEAEKLLERLATEYADLKEPDHQRPLGEIAKGDLEEARAKLFEIRYLAIGKPVPDIEGEDLDGNKFKLSEYRGKVVLLNFWGHW